MDERVLARRLRGLNKVTVLGRRMPVAEGFRSRLLGLAFLDRDEAGRGLLIPRCSSVHTFGMRFPLDLLFLDSRHGVLLIHLDLPPRRLVSQPGAVAVLELPSPAGRTLHRFVPSKGGESGSPAT
jgi:uncharacterized protein